MERFQFSIAHLMVVVFLAAVVFWAVGVVQIPISGLLIIVAAIIAIILVVRAAMLLPFKERVGVALGSGFASLGGWIHVESGGPWTDLGLYTFGFGLLLLVVTFHAWMKR
jgi:hypothetical protein